MEIHSEFFHSLIASAEDNLEFEEYGYNTTRE